MIKRAAISPCGRYRYWLLRAWDAGAATMVFVMLNPSVADAAIDDPTIRRCIGFARREGFGGIFVVNLFAFRSASPKRLKRIDDPVGAENQRWRQRAIEIAKERGAVIVAAWGAGAGCNAADFCDVAASSGVTLMCLGRTRDGGPRHPLYVRADQPFEPFP
jgi:hypothetical protein